MNNIFSTSFEMSLRILLLLSTDNGVAKTADMIALTDTITIYSGAFDLSVKNLHGDIDFVLDKFDTRRELVKQALKDLALKGLINIAQYNDGFRYAINEAGQNFCVNLTSDYANEYREMSIAAHQLVGMKNEREVFVMINATAKRFMGR